MISYMHILHITNSYEHNKAPPGKQEELRYYYK